MRTYRELLPDEFDKVPHEAPGRELYNPENSRILAAIEDDGSISATWVLFACAHVEPLYVVPECRQSPTILRRMADEMKKLLDQSDIRQVYSVVLDETPVLHRFAKWFGAKAISGSLYTWVKE